MAVIGAMGVGRCTRSTTVNDDGAVGGHVVRRVDAVLVGDLVAGDWSACTGLPFDEVGVGVEGEGRRAAGDVRRLGAADGARRARTSRPVTLTGSLKVTVTSRPWRHRSRRSRELGDRGSCVPTGRVVCARDRRRCRWRSRPTRPPGRRRRTRWCRRRRPAPCGAGCCRPSRSGRCPTRCPGRSRPGRSRRLTVVPLRSTTASSPLNQPDAVRLVGLRRGSWAFAPRTGRGRRRRRRRPCRSRLIVRPALGRAVEEHLDVVAAGRQVDRRAGAVVDLEGLVVARALDVLGEEQLGRRGSGRRHRGHHDGHGHGEGAHGDPSHEPTERRSHGSSRVQRGAQSPCHDTSPAHDAART